MIVKCFWDFNIESNPEILSKLKLSEDDLYHLLDEENGDTLVHTRCCSLLDVPEYINLSLYYDDPNNISDDDILFNLSEEFKYTLFDFEVISV